MQDEISSLKSKLEECKGQLQSNEQMIRWLNNQVLFCCSQSLQAHHQHCIMCIASMLQRYCLHVAMELFVKIPMEAQEKFVADFDHHDTWRRRVH